MANAYSLSAPSTSPVGSPPVAIFNHVGRAFNDTFALLFGERDESKQDLTTEQGLLRVDGVGLIESDDLKRLFRDNAGATVTLIDPVTGVSADLTYFIVS